MELKEILIECDRVKLEEYFNQYEDEKYTDKEVHTVFENAKSIINELFLELPHDECVKILRTVYGIFGVQPMQSHDKKEMQLALCTSGVKNLNHFLGAVYRVSTEEEYYLKLSEAISGLSIEDREKVKTKLNILGEHLNPRNL